MHIILDWKEEKDTFYVKTVFEHWRFESFPVLTLLKMTYITYTSTLETIETEYSSLF